jgi:uncharacterized protein (TIGR01244 family)
VKPAGHDRRRTRPSVSNTVTFAVLLLLVAASVVPAFAGAAVSHPGGKFAQAPPPDSAAVVALLGGTLNAACPLPGVATAGQPDSARIAALAAAGFRTVLDLRLPDEARGYDERATVKAAGLEYATLPVAPATLADSTFAAFRVLMNDAKRAPVLVHCHSGNRVGVVMVPWLVLDRGWPLERALATAEAGGLRAGAMRDRAVDYVKRHTKP